MKKLSWTAVLLFLLIMVLAGCILGENAPVISDPPTEGGPFDGGDGGPNNETGGDVSDSRTSYCANQYMPVINGASWTYSSSGGDVEPYSFTDNVTDANPVGFTLFSVFDGLTKEQTWACSSEGLVALEYAGGGQASVTTSDITTTFETTEMSGVSLPNVITVGDSWSQTFTIRGVSVLGAEMTSETSGTVQINMTAVGIETVDVPAGSFEAIKIEVQTSLDFLISVEGGESMPFLMSSSGFTWMVEGVGWVKSVSTATMMGTTISDTLELISYTIPE